MNKNKGITLIELVITVIILLILAGISIMALTNTGIFQRAQDGDTVKVKGYKNGDWSQIGEYTVADSKITVTLSELMLLYFSIKGKGGSSGGNGYTSSDIFDETGSVDEKLHIGDFVNYTAGTWTDDTLTMRSACVS